MDESGGGAGFMSDDLSYPPLQNTGAVSIEQIVSGGWGLGMRK
jgi:hypothetical protein